MSDSTIQAPLATDDTAGYLVTEYTTSAVRTVDHLVITCMAIEYYGHGDGMDLAKRVCAGWGKNAPAGSVTSPMGKLFQATLADYWGPEAIGDAALADILATVDRLARDLFGTGRQRWTMVRLLCQSKKIVQRILEGDVDLNAVDFIHDALAGMVSEQEDGLRYGSDTVQAMGGIVRAGYGEHLTDADKAEVENGSSTKAQRDAAKEAVKNRHPDAAVLNAVGDVVRALSGSVAISDLQTFARAIRDLAPAVNGAIQQWDAEATAAVVQEKAV